MNTAFGLRLTAYGLIVAIGTAIAIVRMPAASAFAQTSTWYKGNLHTHTLNSDGDSTPDDVAKWYREHGYRFLVMTDHNFLTNVDGLNAVHGADEQYLVIRGEEITDRLLPDKPLHINGFLVDKLVLPPGGRTVVERVQAMVDAIRSANGVSSINHPNYGWAISPDELAQIQRTRLFEVFNGHPQVNNMGGGGVPSLEETWDRMLSSGKLLYGTAVDDAHTFKDPGNPNVAGPGRGWVYVRAARLEPRAIIDAVERGDFYSSTGVELQSLEHTSSSMTIAIKPLPVSSKYRVQFIGRQGRVLQEAITASATYTFKGDEGYVRAKVIDSNGRYAWIQPVPVGSSAPK
jgi:hypothetical protein